MISCWFKFVAVKVSHDAALPACTDWLFAGWTSSEDLYVNHVMLLGLQFSVKIGSTVKNKVSRLKFLKFQIDGQSVILISLVPSIKFEAEIFLQVQYCLPDKGTTIKENWRVIILFSFFPVSFSVWNSEVLFDCFEPFFAQVLFESGVFPVNCWLACDIISIFHLVSFGFSKPIEICLKTLAGRLYLSEAKQDRLAIILIFLVCGIFERLHQFKFAI